MHEEIIPRPADEDLAEREIGFLGLGSNLGDRADNLERALKQINSLEGVSIIACSSIYQTAPIPASDQADHFNMAIKIASATLPHDLLTKLNEIEEKLGRIRGVPNAARTIDIDILLFGSRRVDDEKLKIPHPRITERAFVLLPLIEIAGSDMTLEGVPLSKMLDNVRDQRIKKIMSSSGEL